MSEKRRRHSHKYNFGDIVHLKGHDNLLFRIASYTAITYFYPDATYKELKYELTRIPDEEYFESSEEEMSLVCTAEKAAELLKKFQSENHFKKPLYLLPPAKHTHIDQLLDDYIIFMELYHLLGDEHYKSLAEQTKEDLKKLANN